MLPAVVVVFFVPAEVEFVTFEELFGEVLFMKRGTTVTFVCVIGYGAVTVAFTGTTIQVLNAYIPDYEPLVASNCKKKLAPALAENC